MIKDLGGAVQETGRSGDPVFGGAVLRNVRLLPPGVFSHVRIEIFPIFGTDFESASRLKLWNAL